MSNAKGDRIVISRGTRQPDGYLEAASDTFKGVVMTSRGEVSRNCVEVVCNCPECNGLKSAFTVVAKEFKSGNIRSCGSLRDVTRRRKPGGQPGVGNAMWDSSIDIEDSSGAVVYVIVFPEQGVAKVGYSTGRWRDTPSSARDVAKRNGYPERLTGAKSVLMMRGASQAEEAYIQSSLALLGVPNLFPHKMRVSEWFVVDDLDKFTETVLMLQEEIAAKREAANHG